MAVSQVRVERWVDGVLVDTRMVTRPAVDVNADTIRERAGAALTTNADFLALGSPSNAQVLAQVRALTRQVNGIIRLTLVRLDDISDA